MGKIKIIVFIGSLYKKPLKTQKNRKFQIKVMVFGSFVYSSIIFIELKKLVAECKNF